MHRTDTPARLRLDAASRSVQVFGWYLCATGLALLITPALVLLPLQLPLPQDVWIRLLGIVALALGCTDLVSARAGVPLLVRASVWRRVGAGLLMLVLTAIAVAPPAVALLAAVDLAAAGWTALALRRTAAPSLLPA